MPKREIPFDKRKFERELSKIGTKIAEATSLSQKAKEMCTQAETTLEQAQYDLSELYINFHE